MDSRRQREIGLAAVAVLTIAVAVYLARTATQAPPAAPQPARRGPAPVTSSKATSAASKPTGSNDVDLSALNSPRGDLQETVRDPFRFKPKPPPPPPPPPPRVMPMPVAQPTGPVEPPPPPRITLKFTQTLEIKGKGLLAGLTDGRTVFKGFVGDTIDGRYRILRIGVESLDIVYLDGRGPQTIRKTGQ